MITESRFLNTPTVTEDGVTSFGEWRPPVYGNVSEKLHVVTQADLDRPDLISNRFYGTSEKWWVILDYNNVTDPFSLRIGDKLRIPDWAWGDLDNPGTLSPERAVTSISPSPRVNIPPPYKVPGRVATVTVQQSTIFNLAIQLPDCDSGLAHIELQLATDGLFSEVILSRLTAASIDRWFYFDPWANSGQGAHLPFPASGLDLNIYATQLVYFRITTEDGVAYDTQYYPRYRLIISDSDSDWQGLPPIMLNSN